MKKFRKILAVTLSLIMVCLMMSATASAAPPKKLDLAFVIDTTGSMDDDINEVKLNMIGYLNDLDESGMDYRISVVDYRDFASRGSSYDYEYKVQCDFSSDYDVILNAINGLTLGDGGDTPETVYSALIDGLNELSWRNDAGKTAILMGDAPALDPEPYTGYTLEMATNALNNGGTALEDKIETDSYSLLNSTELQDSADRSPITLFAIATDYYAESNFAELATSTGGSCYSADESEEITDIITEIIDIIPEVIVDPTPELSLWDKIKQFFTNVFYFFTFQFDKIVWIYN